jgi:hypothetical protein
VETAQESVDDPARDYFDVTEGGELRRVELIRPLW